MHRRSIKFYRKNEAEVMKRLGFRPTPNSGAGWIFKEDGQNEQCICQLKSTDKQSISIKQNDLHILEQNAATSHKLPVFALQFLNTDEVWVMIKPEDLGLIQKLIKGEEIKEKYSGFDFIVDEPEEMDYNKKADRKSDTKKNYLARKHYMLYKEQEREQQEREYQKKRKEKNRDWQKRNSNKRG